MRCIKCKYPDSKVVETGHSKNENVIKRRRECLRCGLRFSTKEEMRDSPVVDDRYPTWRQNR